MPIRRTQRSADSDLVERITHVVYDGAAGDVTTPDGCWDIVFRKRRGVSQVLQTGLITRPIALDYESGDAYLSISFKPGVFMPMLPGERMLDRAFFRPSGGARSFWLDGDTMEIPTFENAEAFVGRLLRRGLLTRDETVSRALDGNPAMLSRRTVQRHFRRVLGITPKALQVVLRAQRALELLRGGWRVAEVVYELGYADQAHLTRSLKALMGSTPAAVARRRGPG